MNRDQTMQRLDDEMRLARQRSQTFLLAIDCDVDDIDDVLAAFDAHMATTRAQAERWIDECESEAGRGQRGERGPGRGRPVLGRLPARSFLRGSDV